MTTYRILPDGRRRVLPDGTPRTVVLPGPAGSAVVPESMGVVTSVSASISGVAGASVALGMAFALVATPSTAGGVQPLATNFALTASPSADATVVPSSLPVVFAIEAVPSGAALAQVEPLTLAWGLWATPAVVTAPSVIPAPMQTTFGVAASVSGALNATPLALSTTFALSASVSVSTAALFRSLWLDVYARRQEVLNAIDANNRFLAKKAGDKATANANALVITNTRVDAVDDRVTAEALRTTLLTTRVDGVETTTGTALSNLQTTINQQGENIAVNTQAITAANAEIAGKASAAAVQTLTARTEVVEGQIVTQGQAITAVQGVAGNAASTAASALTTANGAAEAVTNVQLEVKAPFSAASGWEFTANHRGFTASGAVLDQWPLTANDGASVVQSTSGDPQFISPVFSLAGGPNPVIRAMVRRRDAGSWDGRVFWSNNNHGFSASFVSGVPAPPVGEWTILEWDLRDNTDFRSGPLNRLRFDFAAQSGSIIDVKWIALGNYGQGRAAQVTETTRVNVNTVTGRLNATYGFAVAVDGRVIGMRAANDGTVGRIDFVGDAVGFFPPDGAATGMELTPGNTVIRQFGPNFQSIQSAIPFGPDNLIEYFGPNVGVANARKINAKAWKDANGNMYTSGAIIAGAIRNGGYSSSTATNTTYTEGPFGTNGGPIAVNASYSFNQILTANNTTAIYTKGAGSNQATLQLWRKVGAGPLEMVSQITITGSLDVIKEGDTPAQAIYSINGAITYTDTAGGTAQRTFEVRMLNRQQQVVNISGGSTVSTQTNQATGIQTAEG